MSQRIILPLLIISVILTLGSCSSTETIPNSPKEKDNRVALSISAPDTYAFGQTRAESPLRLTANLYALDGNGDIDGTPTPLSTIEIMRNSSETTLMFEVENPGNYCVTVFADHILEGSTISDGHYPDRYYDTTIPGKIIAKTSNENISDFFNNDERDCFVGKIAFTKTINIYENKLVLTRPVCRVLVSAPADPVDQLIESIDITSCSHLDTYNFAIDNTEIVGAAVASVSNPLQESEKIKVEPVNTQLFYFYTFAGEYGNDNRPALGKISLNLNSKENIKLENITRTVEEGLIKPAANYKLSVTGSKGWISAEAGSDDIIVNINLTNDWAGTKQVP